MPEVLDDLDLGEEAVAPDVEPPAVALGRAGDAAHLVVGLQDGADLAQPAQLEGGGETGRSRSDDDDVVSPPARRVAKGLRRLGRVLGRG